MGLSTFKGGVHPYDGKELAKDSPIRKVTPKEILYIRCHSISEHRHHRL